MHSTDGSVFHRLDQLHHKKQHHSNVLLDSKSEHHLPFSRQMMGEEEGLMTDDDLPMVSAAVYGQTGKMNSFEKI